MKQKFKLLSFVQVASEMPVAMSHFDNNFVGIVAGSYSQLHGGENIGDYCLYKLHKNKIVDKIAWFQEDLLTLLEHQDRDTAEELVEEYNLESEEPKEENNP